MSSYVTSRLHVQRNFAGVCPHTFPSGVQVAEMVITPALAANWLAERNKDNRRIAPEHSRRLIDDFKRNRYKQTHQGIAFGVSEMLLDGQNRLTAVVESGMSVQMFVFFNVPPDVKDVLDYGRPRNALDALRIGHGRKDLTSAHTATANSMFKGNQSVPFQTDFFLEHEEAIRFAVSALPENRHEPGVAWAPSRAAIACAFYHCDELDDLRKFARVLHSGIGTERRDETVQVLRKTLKRLASASSTSVYDEMYRKTARALQAYLAGEVLHSIPDPQKKRKGPDQKERIYYDNPFPLADRE